MEKHIVNSTSLFEVDEKFEDPRFMKVRVTAMHSGINRNGSKFSLDVIKEAKDTFANIPILAEVTEHTDKDGNKYLDYTTHAMHVEEDVFNEDNFRIIYDEKVVGIVPESNNFEIVHDDETNNDYVVVDALLFRDYGNYCCDILESRNGRTDVSAEIACEDVAYSAKEKCLEVGKMRMCAITLLGEDVKPGMAKAHAEVFSSNEDIRQNQLYEIMQELKESLDKYNKLFGKEEITEVADIDLLEEVAESEVVEEEVTEIEETTEDEVTVEAKEDTAEDTPEEETVEESEEVVEQNCLKYSFEKDGETKCFTVSLQDKIYALQSLVNETYADIDNDWYYCDVYDEEKYVVMHGWTGNYRQSYKVKKDVYSLVGDRIPVFAQYLTEDEIKALDKMKSDFEELQMKYEDASSILAKYEAEPEKMEILNSDEYIQISDVSEFAELKNSHFDFSVDEVRAKADEILLSFAKHNKIDFSDKEVKDTSSKKLPTVSKKSGRYGNLFSK